MQLMIIFYIAFTLTKQIVDFNHKFLDPNTLKFSDSAGEGFNFKGIKHSDNTAIVTDDYRFLEVDKSGVVSTVNLEPVKKDKNIKSMEDISIPEGDSSNIKFKIDMFGNKIRVKTGNKCLISNNSFLEVGQCSSPNSLLKLVDDKIESPEKSVNPKKTPVKTPTENETYDVGNNTKIVIINPNSKEKKSDGNPIEENIANDLKKSEKVLEDFFKNMSKKIVESIEKNEDKPKKSKKENSSSEDYEDDKRKPKRRKTQSSENDDESESISSRRTDENYSDESDQNKNISDAPKNLIPINPSVLKTLIPIVAKENSNRVFEPEKNFSHQPQIPTTITSPLRPFPINNQNQPNLIPIGNLQNSNPPLVPVQNIIPNTLQAPTVSPQPNSNPVIKEIIGKLLFNNGQNENIGPSSLVQPRDSENINPAIGMIQARDSSSDINTKQKPNGSSKGSKLKRLRKSHRQPRNDQSDNSRSHRKSSSKYPHRKSKRTSDANDSSSISHDDLYHLNEKYKKLRSDLDLLKMKKEIEKDVDSKLEKKKKKKKKKSGFGLSGLFKSISDIHPIGRLANKFGGGDSENSDDEK